MSAMKAGDLAREAAEILYRPMILTDAGTVAELLKAEAKLKAALVELGSAVDLAREHSSKGP